MATASEGYARRPPATEQAGLLSWLTTVDHKRIGILYLVTTAAFFLIGGVEALLMRIQLARPDAHFLGPNAYNQLFTMHGTTMIFLVVMPLLLGFANYFVPLMIGARDMAFPRLNALSYWLLLFGGLLLYFSFLSGQAPNAGWFSYAPLTERPYTTTSSIDYWALGLLVTSVGTIATGINLIATVVKLRAPGMRWSRVPVFVWLSFINAFIIIWAIPSLSAAQVMLLFDRRLGTQFFLPREGGDPVLWQHLFWFFGHPEVYIMVLPAFGMITEVIATFSRKAVFGYVFLIAAGAAIAFYSFLVWAHHMFAVGLGTWANGFFGAASMIIAIPTGIKVFNWLGTMWGGRIRFTTAMLFAIAFIPLFTIGGISGVQFAVVPLDWQLTDTYYVVAHMHYVLFGGTFFAVLAAAYYWFPKITGRMLDERVGKWNFWLQLIGFNLTFFPMHIAGLMGMSRRVYTYPDLGGWAEVNLLSTLGVLITTAALLLLLWNMWVSLRRGRPAGDNPWGAWTLEWQTSSPPPPYNFATIPPIRSGPRDAGHTERPSHAGPGDDPPELAPGPPAIPRRPPDGFLDRISTPALGTLAFISSEAVFFGGLLTAFVVFRNADVPGRDDLNVLRTAVFSTALFASSGTIIMAERRFHRRDHRGFRRWLLATVALGAVFLLGQAVEFRGLYAEEITLGLNPFASAFFTLTGFHAAHVAGGLIALSVLVGLTFAGWYREGAGPSVGAVAIYWHFVDAVWVVIFTVGYLWLLL